MRHFLRLFSYTMRYRWRFAIGVVAAFLVAVLNGVSLTALWPIFDALGDKRDVFLMQVSEEERELLRRAADPAYNNYYRTVIQYEALTGLPFSSIPRFRPPPVPDMDHPIDPESARELQPLTRGETIDHNLSGFSAFDKLRLDTIIQWKLDVNAAGYSPFWVVATACGVLLPVYGFKLLFFLFAVRLIAKAGYRAVRDLRDELYSRLQQLPLTYFYKQKSGELVSRLINDAEVVAAVISSNMRDAITNLFIIITHLGLLLYFHATMLGVALLAIPLIMAPMAFVTGKIRKAVTKSQELMAGLHGHLQESISGARVIRGAAMEDYELERFRKVNSRFYWRNFKQIYYLKIGPYMVELNGVFMALGIFVLGAYFMQETNLTRGQFIAFLATLLMIIRPIIQLSSMYGKIQAASAAGERIFSLMDARPEVTDPERPLPLRRLEKDIRFDQVRFTYPGTEKEVLHGIDLEVPIGSTVALVGESGGGKSTMMDLLARFFEPTRGGILVDGRDIRDFRVKDHRSRIGIVTQDIFLFYGTIFQNIAYGSPAHDRREVEKAARLAYAHDFIAELYEGYNTLVGNRGLSLSGGQRQRIAIARALLHDPEILILDEATSALDTESERLVQRALERLFQNRTTFVIAHRLSTIEKADLICVVSDGQIVDRGTHKELMQRGGQYARLQEISRQIEKPTS